MQSVDFFDFFRTSLFRSKKHSLLSRISKNVSFWLFLAKKNIWEKGRFFDKNHGLNVLQNVDFFDFFRTSLFRSKKHSLLSRISKNVSFWLFFAEKKHIRNRSIFWQKPFTNPFAKCGFFELLLELHFSGVTSVLYFPEYQTLFLSGFFSQKKHIRKRSIFLNKPWTNPFGKCRFLIFLKNVTFVVYKAFFSIQNIKRFFFLAFFAPKKDRSKRSIFGQKSWTNPFAKCRLLSTFLEVYFWGLKSIFFYLEYQKLFLSGFVCWKKKFMRKRSIFLRKAMD